MSRFGPVADFGSHCEHVDLAGAPAHLSFACLYVLAREVPEVSVPLRHELFQEGQKVTRAPKCLGRRLADATQLVDDLVDLARSHGCLLSAACESGPRVKTPATFVAASGRPAVLRARMRTHRAGPMPASGTSRIRRRVGRDDPAHLRSRLT